MKTSQSLYLQRYLEFVGELEDRVPAQLALEKITRTARDHRDRSWRGFNPFSRC